jgi:hypothetical protein
VLASLRNMVAAARRVREGLGAGDPGL